MNYWYLFMRYIGTNSPILPTTHTTMYKGGLTLYYYNVFQSSAITFYYARREAIDAADPNNSTALVEATKNFTF